MKNNDLRAHREELAGEIKDLRKRQQELRQERQSVKGTLADIPANDIAAMRDSEAFKRAEELLRESEEVDRALAKADGDMRTLMGMLADTQSPDAPILADKAPYVGPDARRVVAASEEYLAHRETGIFDANTRHFGTINLGQVADRDSVGSYLSGRNVMAAALPAAAPGTVTTASQASGLVPIDYRGMVAPLLQPLSLLDLIPTGTTDSNTVDFVQVSGLPLGAAETAELAIKPELGLATTDQQAPVRTIAGYIKLARQALADMAGLGTFINQQIPYAVRYRLLSQLIAGDGAGQNLRGLYNTTGVLAPTFTAGDNVADATLRCITQILLSGAEPNFIAINPVDYQTLALTKTTQGNYVYVQPGTSNDHSSPAMMAPMTMWSVPVVRSWAIPAGTPLVGDSNAMTLLIREGLTIRTSDADQDDFVRNRVTVLGEMRCAFVVWRPAALAKVALS